MTVTLEVQAAKLPELLKHIQDGNEVVLTQDRKPIAKMVAAGPEKLEAAAMLKLRAIDGHQVLTPNITQAEIAEDMFDR